MNVVQPIRDAEKVHEIEAYLAKQSKRDRLLFVAGVNTGLRISDLLRLRAEDVQGTHLVITEKKTSKRKFLRINPTAARAFKEYTEGMAADEYLFSGREGDHRPISRARAYQILRQAANRNGLKNIGTHTLRKTFGYHFYQQTKDVAMLQTIFGHSDQSITLRYIGITQDQQDAKLQRFSI